MRTPPTLRHMAGLTTAAIALLTLGSLGGCASVSEGIARALIANENPRLRQCKITGPEFGGINALLQTDNNAASDTAKRVKIIMVHGIGPHQPGYSTEFAEKLAMGLNLTVQSAQHKQITLSNPLLFPAEKLGTLRLSRYMDQHEKSQLLFYELTWSDIFDQYRERIAYDTSGEYSHMRADFNDLLKQLTNVRATDPIIYLGAARSRVDVAFSEAYCWALSSAYEDFPASGDAGCGKSMSAATNYSDDEIVLVSHSLGSRIVLNALHRLLQFDSRAMQSENDSYMDILSRVDTQRFAGYLHAMRNKKLMFYMLSNQVSLLQLGQPLPEIRGQIDKYCADDAPHADRRLFRQLNVVAFSDPNDLLSYGIPPDFIDEYFDSRLCPRLVNVSINVAKVSNIPMLGTIANPMAAHTGYDSDDRVIGLITSGIGNDSVAPQVREHCQWIELR